MSSFVIATILKIISSIQPHKILPMFIKQLNFVILK
jgi:hypothetical protein